MSPLDRLLPALMLAACALALPVRAAVAPAYEVTDLGSGFFPTGVNNSGWVSGYDGRAVLWRPGEGLLDLGTFGTSLGATSNRANAVNDTGVVVGFTWSTTFSAYRGFAWTEGGGLVDLGDLPAGANSSRAEAVNQHGVAGGQAGGQYSGHPSYGNLSFGHAVRFDAAGALIDLEAHAEGTLNSIVRGINDAGVTVGQRDTSSGIRAMLWDAAGQPLNLGQLWGFTGTGAFSNSFARDVNNLGQVALHLPLGSGQFTAAVWEAGTGFTELGLIDGYYTNAQAINDAGLLVGVAGAPGAAGTQAFAWSSEDGVVTLSSLVDPDTSAGWIIVDATAVSENGLIVGRGWHPGVGYRGVLLTPVPEPAGAMMSLVGLLALGALLQWRRRGHRR